MGFDALHIAGVDYGSKLAGTTALAWFQEDKVRLAISEKQKDADQWLINLLGGIETRILFIDAPLSLPSVYHKGIADGSSDYFYRAADRAAQAMSPMFIGGLTARAMRLKTTLSAVECVESYPKRLATALGLVDFGYKKKDGDLQKCSQVIEAFLGVPFADPVLSWHLLDASLALCTGVRWVNGSAQSLGDQQEGLIWF